MELVNNLVLEKDYNIESKCKDTSGMWFIINNKNDYNKKHTHPGSFFSGAYYVKVPEKGSRIIFEDPLIKLAKIDCSYCSGGIGKVGDLNCSRAIILSFHRV